MNTLTVISRSFRTLMLTAILLISTCIAKAQTPYNIQSIPYNPAPYMGTLFPVGDDIFSGVLPIGFTFNFFGVDYNELVISSNGYVTFNLSSAGSYSPWPINDQLSNQSGNVHNSILGPWHDINNALGGYIYYDMYGSAPNREFVVSYYNITMFNCLNLTFTGQIVLHETTNAIDVFISNKDICSNWNGGYAIEGVVNSNGSESYVVPGRDYPNQWSAYSEGYRFQYCSGMYTDTIKGRVYADLNHNCIFDGNDYGMQGRMVTSNNACAHVYTDANGFYTLITGDGLNNVTHTPASGVLPECPANNVNPVTFSGFNMMQDNVDFADTAINDCSDVILNIGTNLVRPCSTSVYTIAYNNPTPLPTGPMTLTVIMPDSFSYASGNPAPTTVNGNEYIFSLPPLAAYSMGTVTMDMLVSCDVTVGVNKTVVGYIDNPGDCDTTDNHGIDCHTVVNSCDPNNVVVASNNLNYVYGEQINSADTLSYQINFQNTGTADAIHIIVKDTLPASLDPNTIEELMSSHPYIFFNDNGRLTFSFMNIHLPDSNTNEPYSHGFVRFKIRQMPGNGMGTLIPNQAHIYFDNNPAVLTNIATDTIAVLNVKQYTRNNEFSIYPNPALDKVTLTMNNLTGSETVQVYNMVGNLVYSGRISNKQQILATGTWAKGVYMIRVNENGVAVASKLLVVE